MRVTVRAFAGIRDYLPAGDVALEVPDAATLSQALAALTREHPSVEPVLGKCACFVDDRLVEDAQARLEPGAVLEILPPYSGG